MQVIAITLRFLWALIGASALVACADALPNKLVDVAGFVRDREACKHFAGEVSDSSDPTRLQEITDQMAVFCTGTDARLAALKAKNIANPEVMQQLNQ